TEKEIPEIRNLAQANSVKAKSIEKESYDRTVTVYNFNVGDSVLLSVEGIRSKFEPAWTGPYKVTEQLQRGNYIIKDSRNNFDVVNGDRLKKFISGNRRVPEQFFKEHNHLNKCLYSTNRESNQESKNATSQKRTKIVFNNKTGPSLQHFLSKSINIKEAGLINSIKAEQVPYINPNTNNDETADFDWGQGRTFYVEVYGCQMNVNDTEILISILESSGYKRTQSRESASIVFLMTCSIRENAENKVWQRLHEIKASNKKNKSHERQVVGVLGCMAERLKDKLLDQDKLVDVVCGPDAYKSLPRLLSIRELTNQGVANVILSSDETYADITPVRLDSSQTNVHLSIMRGCNNMCSFCVVPFTRGIERSRPIDSIVNEVRNLDSMNVRQITLLGQNVNSYRDTSISQDLEVNEQLNSAYELSKGFSTIYKKKDGGRRFPDLLELVAKVNPETKVMFTSPHPKDFPDRLLEVIKKYPNISRSIHLPAQSGSTSVLSRMRRGYSFEAYMELVCRIREYIPDITISTDIIVGFCGETDEEFNQTLKLVESVKYDIAFMFAYSMREKTHAHRNYKDDVPEKVKAQRLQILVELFHKIAKEKNLRYIGQEILVLVESSNPRDPGTFHSLESHKLKRSLVSGHDQYFHKVFLLPQDHQSGNPQDIYYHAKKGQYVKAKVISSSSSSLTAQILSPSSKIASLMANFLEYKLIVYKDIMLLNDL
ncbi:hypothetical protein BB560_002889, partial [Smittium megazygosporum]